MGNNKLTYEQKSSVAYIQISLMPYSPLNEMIYKDLVAAMQKLEKDDQVKVIVILIKDEKVLDSGAKIDQIVDYNENKKFELDQNKYAIVEKISKPVIAAIDGVTIGSVFELALACDFRICSERTKFAFPEINLAILPGGGGTQRLERIVGPSVAKEILYFGTMIDAQRALDIHLVNHVVAEDDLLVKASDLASLLASKSMITLRGMKELINSGSDVDQNSSLKMENIYNNMF